MTLFVKSGNAFSVTTEDSLNIYNELPAGNYVLQIDQFERFFLEKSDSFEITGKLYGDVVKNSHRILTTYANRTVNTGVMLSGEKGSGKTLLAKKICLDAAERGVPTIIINTPFHGDNFNTFIQKIDQECIILFDEFEKVYDNEQQESILTLLDGAFVGKKLFIMTCNRVWKVNELMCNRPGRIFYMIEFSGMTLNEITEYCNDHLLDASYTEQVCKISALFEHFNFDMLKALIEEMNRYGESPCESLKMLNIKPERANDRVFNVNIERLDGKKIDTYDQTWEGNPFTGTVRIQYKDYYIQDDGTEDYEWECLKLSADNLHSTDSVNNVIVFKVDQFTITLTPKKPSKFEIFSAF